MVDPPTYRADPDPEFADRLERALLRRLTATPDGLSSSPGVLPSDELVRRDADPDDREGDITMLDTDDRPTGPLAPRRRSPGRWLLVAAAVAVVAVVGTVLVAVSGDEEKPLRTVTPPTTEPPDTSCPFTAAEVSDVIGEPIAGPISSPSSCEFGDGFPIVYFDYLPASTCTPESLGDAISPEASDVVDGLGVDAYATPISVGISLLVCNGDQPFSVFVDGAVHVDALAATVELAKLVQDG
jgi:hypothetical protein